MAEAIFIDASAGLAILLAEAEAEVFAAKLVNAEACFMSAVSKYELFAGLCYARKRMNKAITAKAIAEAKAITDDFLANYAIHMINIGAAEAETAIIAYGRYGKGGGSKAQLNMGDCFSYACSKNHNLPLLFKGSDFIHTDIAAA